MHHFQIFSFSETPTEAYYPINYQKNKQKKQLWISRKQDFSPLFTASYKNPVLATMLGR